MPKAFVNFEILYPATATKPATASEDHELLFCPEWMYAADGSIPLVTDKAKLALLKALDMEYPDVDGVPGSIGTQFACINKFRRTTQITAAGLLVTDSIFLSGDANFRF